MNLPFNDSIMFVNRQGGTIFFKTVLKRDETNSALHIETENEQIFLMFCHVAI